MQPDFKRFSAHKLFEGLTLHQLTSIFDRLLAKEFKKGDSILNAQTTDLGFHLVIEGFVRIYSKVNDQEMTLTMLEPGDFFGEVSVVEGGTPSAEVRAEEDTVLYLLPRKDFFELAESSTALAAQLWESL